MKHVRKKIYLSAAVMLVCLCCLTACSKIKDQGKKDTEISSQQLQEANAENIKTITRDVVMQNDTEGTATISVQLPDYEALYKKAAKSKNPDQYLLDALQSGKFDVKKHDVTAKVTIENGEEVIHVEEAVKVLLEQELSQAIEVLMEE